MSVPKKRRTKSSQGNRRSHHRLKPLTLNKCEKCGRPVEPHKVCDFCGNYNGREVIKK